MDVVLLGMLDERVGKTENSAELHIRAHIFKDLYALSQNAYTDFLT